MSSTSRGLRPRLSRALLAAGLLLAAGCTTSTPADPAVPSAEEFPDAPSVDATDTPDTPDPLAAFADQQLTWRDCADGAQCATLTVPLRYDDTDAGELGIRLLRLPASRPSQRLGTLVVNPGGPGASGVDFARGADAFLSRPVRQRYDVLGFDPRGVGRSDPVDCLTDAELDAYLAIDPTPDTPAEVRALLQGSRTFAAGCQQRTGAALGHVGTADVVRDLDLLRRVLAEETLTYYGASYGTAIGAEYAAQFPDQVGRFVLDAAIDPRLSGTEVSLGQAEGFEAAFVAFADWCVRSRDGCPGVGTTVDEVRDSVVGLLDQVEREPLSTRGDRALDETLAFLGVAYALYFPPSSGYPFLRQALVEAVDRDGTLLLSSADGYLGREPDGTFADNSNEAIVAVSCLDRPGGGTVADVRRLRPQFLEASPTFGEIFAWGEIGCRGWPVTGEGLQAPVTGPDRPILVVGSTTDLATPYPWAVGLADQLAGGVLLTYDGVAHVAYGDGNPCIVDAVDRFLLEGEPPAADTVCR
jgi:pimeloyl-ACP methyl ester carboxylesterase